MELNVELCLQGSRPTSQMLLIKNVFLIDSAFPLAIGKREYTRNEISKNFVQKCDLWKCQTSRYLENNLTLLATKFTKGSFGPCLKYPATFGELLWTLATFLQLFSFRHTMKDCFYLVKWSQIYLQSLKSSDDGYKDCSLWSSVEPLFGCHSAEEEHCIMTQIMAAKETTQSPLKR